MTSAGSSRDAALYALKTTANMISADSIPSATIAVSTAQVYATLAVAEQIGCLIDAIAKATARDCDNITL
jgi:hypothetical protein